MSKKIPSSRLENLFADLEQREMPSDSIEVHQNAQPGWTWEANSQGTYIFCGPEVQEGLGVSPIEWVGRSLFTYRLSDHSQKQLLSVVHLDQFPAEIIGEYHDNSGKQVQVRMNIFSRHEENGESNGWRGFNQVISLPFQAPTPGQEKPLPSNGKKPAEKKSTGPLRMPELTKGIALQDGKTQKAEKPWTDAAITSLTLNESVTEVSHELMAAALAVPFKIGDDTNGVIEILDENDQRKWSEDDLMLAQDIARQLALAIENARLYTAVQLELTERIRAEKETTRRNQDLRLLNQVGQQLSKLTSRQELLNLVQKSIGEILDHRNLTIAIYDPLNKTLSFPIHTVDNERIFLADRPAGNQIVDYILLKKAPLLMVNQVKKGLQQRNIDIPEPTPKSLLGVPMLAGDRPVGVILVEDFENENAYTSVDAELLSTITAQATTALENSNLFQEITNALQSLEIRERYQGNVAKAVATLTQFGTLALPEVLNTLSSAANNDHTYFAAFDQVENTPLWRIISEWPKPVERGSAQLVRTDPLNILSFPLWVADLRDKGWFTGIASEIPNPEKEYIQARGISSILLLAVPGKSPFPNFLAFEQHGEQRRWLSEEINILRLAADALSNTIIREDLLSQLQVSLDETESLYNASHRLALANNLQEMVMALTIDMHTTTINRAELLLFHQNAQSRNTKIIVAANWHSGSGPEPEAVGIEFPYTHYEQLFFSQAPTFIDNVDEANIDPALHDLFMQRRVRSIAILPLWASKHQMGVLLLESENKHSFSSRETRSYPPLVDQMATAIENQNLYAQTQTALTETELLYQVNKGIAQANDPEALIHLVASQMLPEAADRCALFSVIKTAEGNISGFEVVGYLDKKGEPSCLGMIIPTANLPYFLQLSEPEMLPDILTSNMDVASQQTFHSHGVRGLYIVPLRSRDRNIGFLTVSSRNIVVFRSEETHILQLAAGSFAVALERYRLLTESQRRALELQTAAEIARDTTSTLDINRLLERIVNLLKDRFNFYQVSVFLLDETEDYAVIRESSSEAGRLMKERGHKLAVGSLSVIGKAIATGKTQAIADVSQSTAYYPNPLLPETRAEIGIPLKSGDRVFGALDIQYNQEHAFTASDVSVLQILADQIAVAIQNARAYELSQTAYQEIKEVDRVKSQFLANMSHELRTPLNSIIGFSRVILKGIDGPVNETQKQDLNAIYNSGQHLLTLINNILDLSKIEAGKMELQITELNISDLINGVMSTAVGLVKDKPIRLSHDIPKDLPTVQADQTRVRQILLNFVSNAAKFTEKGMITVSASSVVSPLGRPEVMVTISDTGAGIAPEDQVKLFQPFSQVDDSPTRKTGGTGLGLSICRSMVEMHGGRIGLLHSEPGKGSTFYFTLPTTFPDRTAEPALRENNVILSIDDDPQVISLYQRYLTPQGYQVIPLTDPKQAVARAANLKPYAITLDIMMPEVDGWQVLQKLKNDPETCDIPVVICSILEDEEKGYNLGAADYLIKPFLQEELINTVNRVNKDGKIHKILVIDDDPSDIRLVKKILSESGRFQVHSADGGKSGWEMIQNIHPDAVILDLFMPDMDGFTVLGNLRSDPDFSELPVIVLTGADLSPAQQARMIQLGQHMLTKGLLKEQELLTTLEMSLRKLKKS
jgi:signal transduction histidine kinase/DNA-binding response OmpR family regulator